MPVIDNINIGGVDYRIGSSGGGIGIANEIEDISWTNGTLVIATDGSTTSSSVFKATGYIDCSGFDRVIVSIPIFTTSYAGQTIAGIAFYNANKSFISGVQCELGANSAQYVLLDVPSGAAYFRTVWYLDSYDTYSWDFGFHAYTIDGNAKQVYDLIMFAAEENSEKPSTYGQLNAVNTAIQQSTAPWTTTANGMPNASDTTTIANGTRTVGLPYSSASVEDGYIGISISLYTFMCAVHNPKSVLYTRKSKGYTGYAYYGTVCTSIVSAAWGLPCIVTTRAFPYFDHVTKKDSFYGLELGDMILSSGHAKIITGIIKDQYGRIAYVRASESVYSHCALNSYSSFNNFVNANSGYTAYSYKKLASVDSYVPSPVVQLMDEEPSEISYPDIMSVFGDKITRKYGTDIEINILDSTGYSSIGVYKDGSLIDTKSTVADFTISSPAVGSYEVRMTGTGKTSSTYFDIIDNTITLAGTVLSWTNPNTLAVGGFPQYTVDSNGKALSWNNSTRVHILEDAEKTARSLDVSDITVGGGFRVYAKGLYGSVSWEYKTE